MIVLPDNYMTDPTVWSSVVAGFAQPLPDAAYDGMNIMLCHTLASPTENVESPGFYAMTMSNIEYGKSYTITVTASSDVGDFRWAIGIGQGTTGQLIAAGMTTTTSLVWRADISGSGLVGVVLVPNTSGDWANGRAVYVSELTITESDASEIPTPKVFCTPNWNFPTGVMWIGGENLTGISVVDITRFDNNGSHQIITSPVDLTNERIYNDLQFRNAAGNPVVSENTYDNLEQMYATYLDLQYGHNGAFLINDGTVPLNTEFHYQVTILESDGVTTSVMTTDTCYYDAALTYPADIPCVPVLLSDPLLPRFSLWVGLSSIDPLSYPARSDLKDIVYTDFPVALSSTRSTARTTMRFYTRTLGERETLLALLQTGRVIYLRNSNPAYPETNWYLAVGDLTETRVAADHAVPARRWSLEVARVDKPAGYVDITGLRTYETVRDKTPDQQSTLFPQTYQNILDSYDSYLDVYSGDLGWNAPSRSDYTAEDLTYGSNLYPAGSVWSTTP